MSIQNLAGATMSIVAHIDDDMLFQNPDISNAIAAGGGHTTVFVTAGDAGRPLSYAEDREAGGKAAYSEMTGYDDWVDETITMTNGTTEFVIETSYLESQPDVRLYFLRLPDGNPRGSGYSSNNHESVEKLWTGEIDTITTKDGANTYTSEDVSGLLLGLMELHQPEALLLHDLNSEYVEGDHSDHYHSAQFVHEAHSYYDAEHDFLSYIAYPISNLPENVDGAEEEITREAFYEYIRESGDITRNFDENGDPILGDLWESWLTRQYYNEDAGQLEENERWSAEFSNTVDGWDNDLHIRTTGDVDGDGRADVIGFGQDGVDTAQSNGAAFGESVDALGNLSQAAGGWRVGTHARDIGDVNGDGLDDLVGFGGANTFVSFSQGDGTYSGLWTGSTDYASDDGWDASLHERLVGDVDGDGRADIVAFGDEDTQVALSTGTGFAEGSTWIDDFDVGHGWRIGNHERVLADVNGDGMADIVGFGDSRVIVATSNGAGFDPIQFWSTEFTSAEGWREDTFERDVADVNGDGMADIVAFGEDGVQVALSTGSGFEASQEWSDVFGNADGWNQDEDARTLADVNGDGMADIVAFGNDGVRVALSDGAQFVDPFEGDAPFPTFEVVPPEPEDLLINGDLESSVADNTWTANGDVEGWANSNGSIEAWGRGYQGTETDDNGTFVELDLHGGNNPADTLYQDVQTGAGQPLELTFDAMQRGDDSDHIEVYWRGELIDTVQPDGNDDWTSYTYNVTGSGGEDRLEFRELAGESDGSGPFLDNISLSDASDDESPEALMRALALQNTDDDTPSEDVDEDELLDIM